MPPKLGRPYRATQAEIRDGVAIVVTGNGASFKMDEADFVTLTERGVGFSVHRDRVSYYDRSAKRHGTLCRLLLSASGETFVDHVNGDTLDNTRANIRAVAPIQNNWNRRKSRGASRYKGVAVRSVGSITAQASLNGKIVYLGSFGSEEDAARAYDNFARRNFGSHACLNFPNNGEQSVFRHEASTNG